MKNKLHCKVAPWPECADKGKHDSVVLLSQAAFAAMPIGSLYHDPLSVMSHHLSLLRPPKQNTMERVAST